MKQLFYLLLATSLFNSNAYSSLKNKDIPTKIDLNITYTKDPEFLVTFDKVLSFDISDIKFILSDGSKWHICDYDQNEDENEDATDQIFNEWYSGDDIRIGKVKHKEKYHLAVKNTRTDSTYLANLIIDRSVGVEITDIDENGYIIVTEGKQYWSAGYIGSFTTCKWRPGDRVLINKSTHCKAEDYELINSKNGSAVWASKAEWK